MAAKSPKRSGNPATRATAAGTPTASGTSAFQERSKAVLLRMSRLPPLAVPVVMLVLVLVGLYAALPLAVPALAVAIAFVGWLAILSWPVLTAQGRLLRGLMVGLLLGAMIARITGTL